MRTNYEDDLRASGRLGKVARVMGWRENAALGQLIFFYRATQKACIAIAELEEILDIASIEFDSRDEARQFVGAMMEAQLISATSDNQLEIHGNQQQIKERRGYLRESKARASKGGKKRAASASRREDGTFCPAGNQPATSRQPAVDPANPGIPAPAPAPAPAPSLSSRESPQSPALAGEQQIETTIGAIAFGIPVTQANELVAYHRQLTTAEHGVMHAPMVLPHEITSARMIIARSGGDMAIAKRVVKAYVLCKDRKWWKDRGWPLNVLSADRDYAYAVSLLSMPAKTSRKPADERSAGGEG